MSYDSAGYNEEDYRSHLEDSSESGNIDMIRDYESKTADLRKENCALREDVNILNARINEYEKKLQFEFEKRNEIEMKNLVLSNRLALLQSESFSKDHSNNIGKKHKVKEKIIDIFRGRYGKSGYKHLLKTKLDVNYWKPVFNVEDYIRYNPDIVEVVGTDEQDLLKHFIVKGMSERRRASTDFDVDTYCSCNPDIYYSFKPNMRAIYLHYIEDGCRENRTCVNNEY